MASFSTSYWYDPDGNEYVLPVVMPGDLSDYPSGQQNEHGPFCGMCQAYSGTYSTKSVEGGVSPAHIAYENTIRWHLNDQGRPQGNFYPDPDQISSGHYFGVHYLQVGQAWYTYNAVGTNDNAECNDRGGWQSDQTKIRVSLAIATINGVEKLGLYYDGYDLGPGQGDTWNGWTFAYEATSDNAWSQLKAMLTIDGNKPNPYKPGGYSGEGGGERGKQNFGDYSDMVNPDAMPDETQIGAVASGLISIFAPSKSQVQAVADILWQKDFLDFMDSLFSNIQDLIISFGMVPFTIPTSGTDTITWFDYAVLVPGQLHRYVTLNKPSSQFIEFNMGNVSLTGGDTSNGHASDSVLDYSPYSKLGIYLPFIGYEEMNIDECRGNTINLKYRIDILSGAVLALISINGRTLYQFTGNCLVQLPITSQDCSQMIANTVNVGIAAASAGATGAIASAGDALTSARLENGAITSEMGEFQNAQHAAQVSNASGSLAGATANATMGMKPNYKMSGAISGSTCMVGVKQPYLFLTTPRQSMPDGYEKVCGFPCNMGGKLGDFTGFTVVEDIRLNGLVATSPEVEEIYKLLKSGVIL